MSATFKLAAKKKFKLLKANQQLTQQKIVSPLAKYNDLGQLTCIICGTVVRSEEVWKVHINAKQHKLNVEKAKQMRHVPIQPDEQRARKRVPTEVMVSVGTPPIKKLKGILKKSESLSVENNTFENPQEFPNTANSKTTFFENTLQQTNIKSNLVTIKRSQPIDDDDKMNDEMAGEVLPMGFFDDPVKDAKVHNKEYINPIEEEWENFQKEIKEVTNRSNAIIADEQEEIITERQILEIDEQIRNWKKVLELEKRKEEIEATKFNRKSQRDTNSNNSENESDDEFSEFFDWRTKKLSSRQ